MAIKTAEIRARVEPKLKKESMKVLKKLGLSESEGIRLLLKGLVIHQGIPFNLRMPNEETVQAIEDTEKGNTVGSFYSIDELMEELEK